MNLFTKAQKEALLKNGITAHETGDDSQAPVVKWFNPCGGQTWLINALEVKPTFNDGAAGYSPTGNAYGLCDLGWGCPEVGSVSVAELQGFKGPLGIGIERDLSFTADKTLGEYAQAARDAGRIAA
jgi:hypothetical protein